MQKSQEYKIKPLTTKQILISLDRLTRFKPTEDKYLRVFKDIILSNLIYPKFKKTELNCMEYKKLAVLVEQIFNYSLEYLNIKPTNDFLINKKLLQYEKSVFKWQNPDTKILLENKIDFKAAIDLFENQDLALNLKWLKSLSKKSNRVDIRANFGLKFPIEKVVLVEGITEEILLPKFARIYGCDFDKAGINLISAGGKNQVVKFFYQYAGILKLPIFVLFDNDAIENFKEIKPKLRKNDKVHLIKNGEFEDILSLNLIKRTLNNHFKDYFSFTLKDLQKNEPMTDILAQLFKTCGFEFKKAEFASLVHKNISNKKDISKEIREIISEICL